MGEGQARHSGQQVAAGKWIHTGQVRVTLRACERRGMRAGRAGVPHWLVGWLRGREEQACRDGWLAG
eukprot:362942-Chlamydomonas_euryale.AAC.7